MIIIKRERVSCLSCQHFSALPSAAQFSVCPLYSLQSGHRCGQKFPLSDKSLSAASGMALRCCLTMRLLLRNSLLTSFLMMMMLPSWSSLLSSFAGHTRRQGRKIQLHLKVSLCTAVVKPFEPE